MNDNNLNGFNLEPTNTTPPVTPEVPVAPVEQPTVAPTEPVVPSEPVQPVQQAVQPTVPVMPEAPVMQTPVAPQAPAFNPIETPTVNTTPQAPKNNNTVFIIVVVVLVLIIGGLGAYLILNNSSKKMDSNTTTTTSEVKAGDKTTNEINTSTQVITTNPYTTTQPRTTRSVDSPTPTPTGSKSIQVYRYNISLPGYESYDGNGVTIAVNKTDKVQLGFNAVNMSFENYLSDDNLEELATVLQQDGFDVLDASSGTVGTRPWCLLSLTSNQIPQGFNYLFLVTELDSNTTLEVTVLYNPSIIKGDKIITDLTTALDNKTQAFASGEGTTGTQKDFTKFDNLDERLFN
jgi:hypothetical protein